VIGITGEGIDMADDFDGRVFGRLTVVKQVGTNKHHKRIWLCRCECGAETQTLTGSLTSGRTVSCGCYNKERIAREKFSHGETSGAKPSAEYQTWSSMLGRCTNSNNRAYKYYGGRGIGVCEQWMSFDRFLSDMGRRPSQKHSLDRINVDLGYEPDNCRWATDAEQARNMRSNTKVQINGVTRCVSEWCELNGIASSTAYARINRGINPIVAVTQKNIQRKRVECFFTDSVSNKNASGMRGVTQVKKSGDWQARIQYKGRRYLIGTYRSLDEAGSAYIDFKGRLAIGEVTHAG
jgi:hypothetical protein